jgi:hypothetical protein
VLRYYGPWIAASIALVGLALAYLDLRSRVSALEERVASGDARAVPEAPPQPLVIDAGVTPAPAGPIVSRGAAPPDWDCTGAIAQPAVLQAIGRHGPGVLACFEQRRAAVPDLAGTLRVRVRVDARGGVSGAHVAGVEDEPLVDCVGREVLEWTFAPPEGGECAIVEAPFALGAPETAAAGAAARRVPEAPR